MPGPLAHLRVLDAADVRSALAGRMLGDLGADVLRIEAPGGDPDRLRAPFAGDVAAPDRSLAWLYRNANKRGLALDLAGSEGAVRLDELCSRADVLVESFGPRAPFDREALAGRHPHLVVVSIADFGLSGPRATWRLEALPALAASGALFAAGFPDRPPCALPGYLAHDCASVFAVAGALGAVLERARSGRGQRIEVSVQEAALCGLNPWTIVLADYARRYPRLPVAPPRNADGPYLVLRVRDGWIRILPGTPRHWRAVHELLGRPEALSGKQWESTTYRTANGDVIRLVAAEPLAERSLEDVLREGRRLGFPIVPVNSPEDFVEEEQTRLRGFFRETGFPHLERAPFAAAPFVFSRTPVEVRRPAPVEPGTAGLPERDEPLPHPAGSPPREAPLAGVRVVGFVCGAVGPELCWLLAELGAEVLKIESASNPDFLRRVTLDGDPNHAWTFNDESRGLRSVCLDLATAEGRELALRLCAQADVVVENNRGGVARELGIDDASVRRVRPDVVYLSSQGFGAGGPLGECPSFGPLNSTFAGVNSLWNHLDAPYPAGVALNHPDHIASKLGTVAVLAALEHRRRTGEGQTIDLSQSESAAFLSGEAYLELAATGRPARARGNDAEYAAPHGVYRCRAEGADDERWVAIAAVGDAAWRALERQLGGPPDPELATLEARRARREELDARLAAWTRERRAEDVAAELQAAGVSAMPVQNGLDHRADEHLAARGALVAIDDPDIGPVRHAGNPIRTSRSGLPRPAPAPRLGEHTEAVLGEWLGIPAEETRALVERGVCR